ncbi:MAG TPA: multicopper oxidase domain-containing protein [Gemmatimonadaceae bacterium]|nr:multicopper oxidase domain-containing protein [Gemmatimonadaceae bacterium]
MPLHPSAWTWLVPLAGIVTHAQVERRVLLHAESAPPRIIVNDNRHPAGTLHDGILTLRLDARLGDWHPDGENAIGASVPAFAETGHPARIPGPLVRVPAGTEVALTVRNSLAQSLTLHGLHDRTRSARSGPDSHGVLELAPGVTRAVRFRLEVPGTYYYYGSTRGQSVEWRSGEDAQLSGAIVVDPPGATFAHDRIFVIGVWSDTAGRALARRTRILAVINGRSWPETERLDYAVGDTVHWHVINASADSHPMHLHGFYYRVDGRGDGDVDTIYADGQRRRVNTENVNVGSTMTMTWIPERPGNWLFHCHLPDHFRANGSLGMPRTQATTHEHDAGMGNHALSDMNGLVIGVTVRGTSIGKALGSAADSGTPRDLRLLIRPSAGGTAAQPFYTFAILANGTEPAPDSGLHVGPPLVLKRGEPVRITVVNALDKPTTVHWHGIELDSYYDGVAGFSGAGQRLAPIIAPHDSFVARFTPPRAGTFIYHTHVDESVQQLAGLAGPIIVLDSGRTLDSTTDHAILITTPPKWEDELRSVLLNGSASPAPLALRVGVAQRLRFINMTVRRPGARILLWRDSTMATWRPLAKDGADLPGAFRTERPARAIISIGETMDYEILPTRTGRWRIEVGTANGVVLATMPITVTGAPADSSGMER